jgi:PAS domain S-box-containing protein
VGVAIHHAQLLDRTQQSEQRFRAIFDNALYFIQILDTDGHYVDVNPSFCQFMQLPKEQIIGKTLSDLFEFEPDYNSENLWNNLLQEGMDRGEIPLTIRHTSQRIILSYSAITHFLPGLHLAVAHDITQQKTLEVELQKNAETLQHSTDLLLNSNSELEQFATIASHDLQTPLRKVLMFTESLKQSDGAHLSDTGLDYIDRIQKASHRMQDLITDLLALSRITRKGKPFQSVDLNEVIATVWEELECDLKQKQATLEAEPLPVITADSMQIRQLFQNLIENALKFQRADIPPHIRIYLAWQTQRQICIGVQDNGIGFKQEYADKIFKVFERLHSAASYPGTGMGLAICRKIIERHGGTIQATGQEGEGATFLITLPVVQASLSTNLA